MDNRPTPDGLEGWWGRPVSELAAHTPPTFEKWESERHRIYSLLVCAILFGKWNGNKYGQIGDYGKFRKSQVSSESVVPGGHLYSGGTYEGHNICAIAVDGEGRIMDYEFNHNNVFDSTVEHAESRLVRRLFALNQIYAPWKVLSERDSKMAVVPATRLSSLGSGRIATSSPPRPPTGRSPRTSSGPPPRPRVSAGPSSTTPCARTSPSTPRSNPARSAPASCAWPASRTSSTCNGTRASS